MNLFNYFQKTIQKETVPLAKPRKQVTHRKSMKQCMRLTQKDVEFLNRIIENLDKHERGYFKKAYEDTYNTDEIPHKLYRVISEKALAYLYKIKNGIELNDDL